MDIVPPLAKKFPTIEGLDSLRFFAFLAVFLSHSIYFLGLFSGGTSSFLIPYLTVGDLGVSAFFILSGFLITGLLLTEKNHSKTISLRNFYGKRILRIWPLYFLIVILGCFIIPHVIPNYLFPDPYTLTRTGSLWKLITFTFNLGQPADFMGISLVLAVLWSLSVEEQFYIIWPWIVKYVSTYFLTIITSIVIISSVVARIWFVDNPSFIEYNTLSVMGDIALGSLLGIYYIRLGSLFKSISHKIHYLLLTTGIFTTLCIVYLRPSLHQHAAFRVIEPLVFGIGIITVIMSIVYSDKFGKNPVTVFLGKISYGLYMYHVISMIIVLLISKYIATLPVYALVICSFVATISIATLSYYLFEKRFLSMKHYFS